jgi:hypothetical protein
LYSEAVEASKLKLKYISEEKQLMEVEMRMSFLFYAMFLIVSDCRRCVFNY